MDVVFIRGDANEDMERERRGAKCIADSRLPLVVEVVEIVHERFNGGRVIVLEINVALIGFLCLCQPRWSTFVEVSIRGDAAVTP